jgi:hypothetical protein
MYIYLETGGVAVVPFTIYDLKSIDVLTKAFEDLLKYPTLSSMAQMYLGLIGSLYLPKYQTNIVEDLPVHYLGYKRSGKTSFLVRLKEAIRVLLGKPSQAYFTQEDGDFADGMYKDAMRVTLDGQKIRDLAYTAFSSSFAPAGSYVLPVWKFIPADLEVPEILKEYQNDCI